MVDSFRNDSYFKEADENYVFGPDDFHVGIIVCSVVFLGFLIQLFVVFGAYNIPKLHSTFGFLMFNETFAQFLAGCVTFVFYFLGLILSSKTIISNSNYFGNTSLVLLPTILIGSFLMSFNRLCASSMPFGYKKIFNKTTLKYFLTINWTFPILIFSYFFYFYNCNFVFFQFGWVFMEQIRNEKCGSKLVVLSLSVQFIIISTIIVFNIITFIILITCRRKIFKSYSKDHTAREVNFAVQVLVQGLVMVLFLVWYAAGYKFLPGNALNWKIFISTTLSANSLHCTAPAVIFVFNAEFRRWMLAFVRNRRSKKSITMVSSRVEPSK